MTSFFDDFNRANGAPGANWVDTSGLWTIVSNQLSSGTASGTIIIRVATAMATNDNSAQVTIAATGAVSHGVWCRGNTTFTSGYLWRNDGTSWNLFSNVGGSFTSLGSFSGAAVAGDIAKITAVGSTITGYVNGVARVTVTNTAVTTGTSVGIRAESTNLLRFDDFTGADVAAGATLGIATETDSAQALTAAKTATLALAAETDAAQGLTGSKAATLPVSSAAEAAQPLPGTKTVPLSLASTIDAAQTVVGAKTGTVTAAAATESAQTLTGTKTSLLTTAGSSEAAQPLTGSKTGTLGTATEVATTQPLAGAKTASLPITAQTETAQPFTVATSQSLTAAASAEAAQPLAGAKTATLTPAVELSSARQFAAIGAHDDINITVGTPYSDWTIGTPQPDTWPVTEPQDDGWKVATPW